MGQFIIKFRQHLVQYEVILHNQGEIVAYFALLVNWFLPIRSISMQNYSFFFPRGCRTPVVKWEYLLKTVVTVQHQRHALIITFFTAYIIAHSSELICSSNVVSMVVLLRQTLYVLCIYNKKEKHHRLIVSSALSQFYAIEGLCCLTYSTLIF